MGGIASHVDSATSIQPIRRDDVGSVVSWELARHPVFDFHTHLYSPRFGTPLRGRGKGSDPNGLLLWGIDELLTYHYLLAEFCRVAAPSVPSPPASDTAAASA